jgi:hypothetical protein
MAEYAISVSRAIRITTQSAKPTAQDFAAENLYVFMTSKVENYLIR